MQNDTHASIALKKTAKENLKAQYGFKKTSDSIGIVALSDEKIRDFIIRGLSEIGSAAVVLGVEEGFDMDNIVPAEKLNSNQIFGFDFFIYDNEFEGVDVVKYMNAGIVPIMPEKNTFSGILKDFNPMKFEGNGFFWRRTSPYCIFEKLVCYLENVKFPEDRRVLIRNVITTF